jgi:hypothetical protein
MMATDLDLDTDDIQMTFDDATMSHSPAWHEPTIRCPKCETDIKLTESLAAPLVEAIRVKYEHKLARQQSEFAKRETHLRARECAVNRTKEELDQLVERRVVEMLNTERAKITAAEARRARDAIADELAKAREEKSAAEELVKDRETKLAEARKNELALRQERQCLQEEKDQFELAKQRAIDAERANIRAAAQKDADEQARLRLAEKDKTITDLQVKLQEALRKAEQGSQQLQGEVQEIELETLLRARFPHDSIDPVPKGEHGGDVLHCVVTPVGVACGKILWEAKRTKNWSDGWLPKLREDQRAAKAEVAVIVSQALPKGLDCFDLVDGVWVISSQVLLPMACALREFLMGLALARQAREGQQTKIAQVYEYLTGPEFRHHVEAILEKTSNLHADLKKERDFMTKQWAKREKHIRQVGDSMLGIYGDLQGIAGKTLLELENLDVKLLADDNCDSESD